MRNRLDRERLDEVMRHLGGAAREPVRVYLTGGATAVLLGWRDSTLDLDFRIEPERSGVLGHIPALKELLQVNLEPASPQDFLPELPGWRDRALFIRQEGRTTFLHYDFYAQTLAKIERGHTQDVADVRSLLASGLVDRARLRELFEAIVPEIDQDPRWAAIDLPGFRRAFDEALATSD